LPRTKTAVIRENTPTEERNPRGGPVYPALPFMHTEPEIAQFRLDAAPRVFQKAPVVVEQQKIIHIPAVGARAYRAKNKLIQRVQINVGEELRRLVAQWQPAPPPARREQVVAREVGLDRFLRVRSVDDASSQGESGAALEDTREQVLQDGVVDGRKILPDIALEDEWEAHAGGRGGGESFVRAESGSAGIAVGSEPAFESGLDDLSQGMVNHAVPKGRG
jgi:hypothetical protein